MIELDALFKEAERRNASDIYFKTDSPVTLRVDGDLFPYGEQILTPEETQRVAYLMMNERQRHDFLANPEMNLAYAPAGGSRYRVNIYQQRGSLALVMRRVKSNIPTLESLNLPPILGQLAMEERGLILVTGAAGTGKSTTLAAMIHQRNQHMPGHILTVEDPVEFVHTDHRSLISQREIGVDTDSFEMALKNALRQTPDVILIGEMRDRESVKAALDFAETGHLVLSTLHSTNANQAVERVLQFFPADQHWQVLQALANNLKATISQRLLHRAEGQGLLPAVEILIVTQRVKEILRASELVKLKVAMEQGTNEGMQTFDQHLFQLCQTQRTISLEEALANADSPNDLRLRIRGLSSGGISGA